MYFSRPRPYSDVFVHDSPGPRAGRRDVGAAALEMAIVLPLLVALCFGIIDFARILNAQIQLSQAAREGVRLAALGAAGYTAAQVVTRARSAAPDPGFTGTAITVDVRQMCSSASAPTATASVSVHYTFTGILFPARTFTQTAVMRCGG